MPRTVAFYRSSRPQAPKYAKAPALADKVECSICRGLFLPDDTEAKDAHRRWHKMWGDTTMPCEEAREAGYDYQIDVRCTRCGEDICPCTTCRVQHGAECELWVKAWNLADTDPAAGEAAMAAIIEARKPCSHSGR